MDRNFCRYHPNVFNLLFNTRWYREKIFHPDQKSLACDFKKET